MVAEAGRLMLERLKELELKLSIIPEALFEHPELAATVFEAVSDAIIISDKTNKIRLVNSEAEKLFGYTRKELLGLDLNVLIPPEYRELHAAKQESYFENPTVRVFTDLEALRKDGTRRKVEIALHPVASDIGTLIMATIREEKTDGRR